MLFQKEEAIVIRYATNREIKTINESLDILVIVPLYQLNVDGAEGVRELITQIRPCIVR